MPKVLIFAPCEKVVISQDENNPTLIAVLREISGEYEQKDTAIAMPTIAPMRWSVFTMLGREADDDNRDFEQRFRLLSPTGRKAIEMDSEFKFQGLTHRITSQIGGIPIGENGEWTIELYLREQGHDWPPKPVATYPLKIQFTRRAVRTVEESSPR